MEFKQLYLYPDLVSFHEDYTSKVRYETRCLCNFIERTVLRKLHFKTENFNRVCVIWKNDPTSNVLINSCNVATVEVGFNEKEYLSKTGETLQEYFIALLLKGLKNANKEILLPINEINSGVESFRECGYKNVWIHKSKPIKGKALKAQLHCELAMEWFKLTFVVVSKNKIIEKNEILNTEPDEILFKPGFKDIIVKKNLIQVTDRLDSIIYTYKIQ